MSKIIKIIVFVARKLDYWSSFLPVWARTKMLCFKVLADLLEQTSNPLNLSQDR